MSGYTTYTRWQRIEEQAKTLGFRLANPKHGWGGGSEPDQVALYPDGEALPIFSRDADIFTGTFGQVETFLTGWVRAQQYDAILGTVDDKRRKKYEDRELARQAEQRKRKEQAELVKVLRATDEENRGKK
jgi:hypothetical protein